MKTLGKKEKKKWKNRFKQAFSRHKPSQIWPKYAKFAKVFALEVSALELGVIRTLLNI